MSMPLQNSIDAHDKLLLGGLRRYSVRVSPPDQPFTLASGEKSRFYVDVKQTAMRGEFQIALARLLHVEVFTFYSAAAVAGVVLGGCHLASIVAYYACNTGHHYLNTIHVRKEPKEHGTKKLLEGVVPTSGSVVLIEDVITTGGSSLKAIQALEEAGARVDGVVCVVDRRAESRTPLFRGDGTITTRGYQVRALYTLKDFDEQGEGLV